MGPTVGYAISLARSMLQPVQTKWIFGKPFVRMAQFWGPAVYCFQMGGILGAKYANKIDAFGHAFLGVGGPSGGVRVYLSHVAKRIQAECDLNPMTFTDYVIAWMSRRTGSPYTDPVFFVSRSKLKLRTPAAESGLYDLANEGAALGVICPGIVHEMYARSNKPVEQKEWERMHAAGLDITEKQDLMTYEEAEHDIDRYFLSYCQDCCPRYHSALAQVTELGL